MEVDIYINGQWYYYNATANNGAIIQPNPQKCHTHSESAGCYKDTIHQHNEECYAACKDGLTEHKHTDTCYTYEGCEVLAHTHNADCYRGCIKIEHVAHNNTCNNNEIVYVITAKYEQNIAGIWPTSEIFEGLYGWKPSGNNVSTYVTKRFTMTSDLCGTNNRELTLYVANGTPGDYTVKYMLESFDQTSGQANDPERRYNNNDRKWFDEYKDYTQSGMNSNLGPKAITGLEDKDDVQEQTDNRIIYFYYERLRYTATFYSEGNIVATRTQVMFEQPMHSVQFNSGELNGTLLSEFEPVPDPNKTEPGSVKFAGWYTTPDCLDGTEYVFSTAIMPNGNLELYAKWEPVYFNVTVYANSNDVNANKPLPSTDIWVNPQRVAFGEKAVAPARPESPYDFVGWFYQDASGEHSFVFATSQVRSDMHIYAKWESRIYVKYEVHYTYTDANGNKMDVADQTTGEELAGSTDTFPAKTGTQLYDNYQNGMFPKQTSLAVQYTVEGPNRFEFEYQKSGSEMYCVEHYVKNDDDEWELAVRSDPISTNYAQVVVNMETGIVTQADKEKFGELTPDAYQKTFIVKATDNPNIVDEDNVVKFYWIKSDNFLFQVEYYLQDVDDENSYTLDYSFSDSFHKNTLFTREIMQYDGFTVATDKLIVKPTGTSVNHTAADSYVLDITLGGNSLIQIFYNRNSYKYTINYLHQVQKAETDNTIYTAANGEYIKVAASKTLEAPYGSTVSYSAKDDAVDAGYVIGTTTAQTLYVSSDESKNVMNFYYQQEQIEIRYVLISELDNTQVGTFSEYISAISGDPKGYSASEAAGMDGFKFMGWYDNKEFTGEPDLTTNLKPGKTGTNLSPTTQDAYNGKQYTYYKTITYYGKFVAEYSSLMISNSGIDLTFDPDQAVIFDVVGNGVGISGDINVNMTVTIIGNGNVTITNLPVGTYTVTPRTDWSWRYTVNHASESVLLTNPHRTEAVTFASTLANSQWLSDNDYAEN